MNLTGACLDKRFVVVNDKSFVFLSGLICGSNPYHCSAADERCAACLTVCTYSIPTSGCRTGLVFYLHEGLQSSPPSWVVVVVSSLCIRYV